MGDALPVGHNLADHVFGQSDRQAANKGAPSATDVADGVSPRKSWGACMDHVAQYHLVMAVMLALVWAVLPLQMSWGGLAAGLAVSAVTHAFFEETLDHSTITMTLDTYAHAMQTTLKAAADRMDDALGVDEPTEDEGAVRGARQPRDRDRRPCWCHPLMSKAPWTMSRGPLICCALGRIRTCNLLIRSQMLYPLSYERLAFRRFFLPVGVAGTTLHDLRREAKSIARSTSDLRKRPPGGPREVIGARGSPR
ncbi:hypothetical protein HOK021_73580 [Streptomyces hygroscopicus]|nr:hypothetical protein HOK021_73580 [Streptomyces hygroscopicus]